MREKFKEYQFVYLFGKDRRKGVQEDMSLREKRKKKADMAMKG